MSESKLASINPEDFVSTGLVNDADVEVLNSRTCMFKYPGTEIEACAVELTVKILETGDESLQHLTAGKGFVPDKDGIGFVATGSKTALEKSSNFFVFLASALKAGFPKEKLGNDVRVFTGLKFHLMRLKQEGRAGTNAADKEVIVCDSILPGGLPGEKAAPAAAKKGAAAKKDAAAAPAAAAAAAGPVDIEARAKDLLVEIVKAAENKTIAVDKIRNAGFKAMKEEPGIRSEVLAKITDKAWLESVAEGLELMFDGNEVAG